MAIQSNNKSGKSNNAKAAPVPAAKAVPPPAPAPAAKVAPKPVKAPGRRQPTQDEIGVRAFEIFVSEGCQEGHDLENWLRAEKELRS
jgi:hypothetical protein